MATEHLTADVGTLVPRETAPRVFLVVHDGEASRLVDLVDGAEITFGRSRGAVVHVKHDNVSRLHTRVTRRADIIEVEDLGSRNGTFVNGEKIAARRRVVPGDEIVIGSIHVVVGASTGLARARRIAAADAGEARLAAEVDRSVRYRRPVTLALVRVTEDAALDAMTAILRPMDLLAEVAGDDYLVILPELDRTAGTTAVTALVEAARKHASDIKLGTAVCPEDGTTVDALLAGLRTSLRTGKPAGSAPHRPSSAPIVLDPAMQRVYALVDKVADSAMTVLVLGETGVGKELVAEAIHHRSARRAKPFVKVNCAALPETLLESELFGHERGAFTGADRRKVGFFEAADGGTFFLDEIGEIPLSLQAKLLRVLERKVITRVGSTAEIAIDVRLVAATHRDLEADVRDGRFRQDLLFRIGGFTIVVPPLRDRPAEILPLAEHFARLAAAELGRAAPPFSPDARAALEAYEWPGNVRELENAIERALVMCGDAITLADLPERLADPRQRTRTIAPAPASGGILDHLAELERTAIIDALAAHRDNQTHAARALGLSRRALIYKMEKYGLKPPPSRR